MSFRVSQELIREMHDLSRVSDYTEVRLGVASIITRAFEEFGLEPPVVVGGTAVSLYTLGGYGTVDVDLIVRSDFAVNDIMTDLGFARSGKDYYHPQLNVYVEFPSGEFSGTPERCMIYSVASTTKPLYVIGVEDIILDRIESYVSTHNEDAKEWALRMMAGMYSEIDWSYFHHSAHERGILSQAERIQREYKRYYRKQQELDRQSRKMQMFNDKSINEDT